MVKTGMYEAARDLKEVLVRNIYQRLDASIPKASVEVVDVSKHWGAKKSEGGTHPCTYKAICRRA
jgi:hypothetical protein